MSDTTTVVTNVTTDYELSPHSGAGVELVFAVSPVTFRIEVLEGEVRLDLRDADNKPKDIYLNRTGRQSVFHYRGFAAYVHTENPRARIRVTLFG